MISKAEILGILKKYDKRKIAFATICSHSALQLFHGIRQERFRSIGICTPERRELYESYPLARPDEFIIVDDYAEVLEPEFQENLRKKNAIIIPHGSFVEYVGAQNIHQRLRVPMFGNRQSLEWESSRKKVREWLKKAGVLVPREFATPAEIETVCIVKFSGAKGGRGFFLTASEADYEKKMHEKLSKKVITKAESESATIQEFINGVRYYPHYFYSPMMDGPRGRGRVELLSIDKRLETNVEEIYRILAAGTLQELNINPSYVVTGNAPLTIRESLLPEVYNIGKRVHQSSLQLFGGIVGPYCVEMVCTPELELYAFEISARIVAGTNLYPQGSFLTPYLFDEPMSTGRRIGRELNIALKQGKMDQLIY
ncbi:MAG TPA: formate--phosphoribosylaminoimidazolecarboxamide ligase [Candidatus Norongarragalinales archaeon]|nr:formate--phosphoribosylaminoimidazolecarboxamide ligase [Candidatus Norongarragalinales archaeon]